MEIILKIKIWNNGWKIEIVLSADDEIVLDTHVRFLPDYGNNCKIIPIEDYLGSEDTPEEEFKLHLMSSAEKDMLRKSGKDPLKYYKSLGKEKPLAYKQAIYQENKKMVDYTIVDEFMELFELFLKLNERNRWIYVDGFKMYVRKSKRFYNKQFIDFIDLATIESDKQGTGLFTLILTRILDKYKDKNFYVENVMTDRFLNFFKKFGFIDYPLYDRCLIKISDEKKINEKLIYTKKELLIMDSKIPISRFPGLKKAASIFPSFDILSFVTDPDNYDVKLLLLKFHKKPSKYDNKDGLGLCIYNVETHEFIEEPADLNEFNEGDVTEDKLYKKYRLKRSSYNPQKTKIKPKKI